MARAAGDAAGIANALYHLGTVAELQGHDDQADTALRRRRWRSYRDLGDERRHRDAAMVLGDTAYRQGEHGRAVALAQEALAVSEAGQSLRRRDHGRGFWARWRWRRAIWPARQRRTGKRSTWRRPLAIGGSWPMRSPGSRASR